MKRGTVWKFIVNDCGYWMIELKKCEGVAAQAEIPNGK